VRAGIELERQADHLFILSHENQPLPVLATPGVSGREWPCMERNGTLEMDIARNCASQGRIDACN